MAAHRTWALALALALFTARAAAQSGGGDLDALIAEALELRAQGRDAEALTLLTRAWDETRSPRARAQMARAEQALGRWLDAHTHITEALAAPSDPWIAARVALLDEERARIREHLGRVEVLGLPAGARVRVDEGAARVAPLAEPLWCAAGAVVLRVEADGYYPLDRRVIVDAGGVARETVTLVPVMAAQSSAVPQVAPPVSSPPPDAPATRDARAVLGAASAIAGGVFLAGGAAAHVARELAVSAAVDRGCANDTDGRLVGPSDCAERVSSIEVATALLATGYAVGALFVGTGVTLLLTAPRAAPPAPRVACAPWSTGLACALRF